MTFELNKEGRGVNRKRVRRLMRVMGIEALGSAPRHGRSRARAQDVSLPAARPDDRRAEPRVGGRHHLHPDGVRLPLSGGDHRLGQPGGLGVAAVEHHRCALLRGALEEALVRFGKPEIFNTDQGAQFTARRSPAGLSRPGSR